ncbi:MAG: hypothetical protein SFX19_02585 [Alphaproteobacteria bacterium]|nr:hypothetical protein [Alphaproteobacteria bacterium]
MSFFSRLFSIFNRKKKREDEWAKNFAHIPPAKPDNLLPLDPNDPWKT